MGSFPFMDTKDVESRLENMILGRTAERALFQREAITAKGPEEVVGDRESLFIAVGQVDP